MGGGLLPSPTYQESPGRLDARPSCSQLYSSISSCVCKTRTRRPLRNKSESRHPSSEKLLIKHITQQAPPQASPACLLTP